MLAAAFALPSAPKGGLAQAVESLCRKLLEAKEVELVMVPKHLPQGNMVQYVLIREEKALEGTDPFAPVLAVNGGTLVAKLTRQDPGAALAAVLRPCEIRAFVELVKLHQGDGERVLLVGTDCLGTMEPLEYRRWAEDGSEATSLFLDSMLGKGSLPDGAPALRRCCQACEYPIPEGADVHIPLVGMNGSGPLALAGTRRGEEVLERLGLQRAEPPMNRQGAVDALVAHRSAYRDELFHEVESRLLPLEKLLGELSRCVNCYNCRDVCPVCYCKSCVMDSSTMEHPSSQYVRWARRKGAVKMPAETLFYHVTRMAHMSTSCVGCGQCSSACPMGIPVAEIFRTVARRTQAVFHYVPGRSLQEPLPMATFREDELEPR